VILKINEKFIQLFLKEDKMSTSTKKEIFIDREIPIEEQINFLRNCILERDLTVYTVLKDHLGEEGKKLYHSIKVNLMNKALEKIGQEEIDFERVKQMAGIGDRILGYRLEKDYERDNEIQLSFKNCPYFEKAKEYGLEKEICDLICEFESQQLKERGIGQMDIISRIAQGADKCIFRLRKL